MKDPAIVELILNIVGMIGAFLIGRANKKNKPE